MALLQAEVPWARPTDPQSLLDAPDVRAHLGLPASAAADLVALRASVDEHHARFAKLAQALPADDVPRLVRECLDSGPFGAERQWAVARQCLGEAAVRRLRQVDLQRRGLAVLLLPERPAELAGIVLSNREQGALEAVFRGKRPRRSERQALEAVARQELAAATLAKYAQAVGEAVPPSLLDNLNLEGGKSGRFSAIPRLFMNQHRDAFYLSLPDIQADLGLTAPQVAVLGKLFDQVANLEAVVEAWAARLPATRRVRFAMDTRNAPGRRDAWEKLLLAQLTPAQRDRLEVVSLRTTLGPSTVFSGRHHARFGITKQQVEEYLQLRFAEANSGRDSSALARQVLTPAQLAEWARLRGTPFPTEANIRINSAVFRPLPPTPAVAERLRQGEWAATAPDEDWR